MTTKKCMATIVFYARAFLSGSRGLGMGRDSIGDDPRPKRSVSIRTNETIEAVRDLLSKIVELPRG